MLPGTFDEWIDYEWLLTNGHGAFACSTLIGCPTRREHGWLTWNQPGPRLKRWMLWSHAAEHVQIDGRTYLLANFEFNNAIDPHGYRNLTRVEVRNEGPSPFVRWTYEIGSLRIVRQVRLVEGRDAVVVRYEVDGRPGVEARLQVWPLIASRALNTLRRRSAGELFDVGCDGEVLGLTYRQDDRVRFGIVGRRDDGGPPVEFHARGDWWYNFRYRREAERGLDFGEDLMVPGAFTAVGRGPLRVELIGLVGHRDPHVLRHAVEDLLADPIDRAARISPQEPTISVVATGASDQKLVVHCEGCAEARLERAARQFMFRQTHVGGTNRLGLVAGYPWLDEYARDACMSIPGLLLETGRVAEARELLLRLALLRRNGALPSHISDEPDDSEYVSADAALWLIHAIDAYLHATDDASPAAAEMLRASLDIVRAMRNDEHAGMRCDDDGLLVCEDVGFASTWMDARYAWVFSTPRTGKAVDVNALWYHALCVLAARAETVDSDGAAQCATLAALVRDRFAPTFWNPAVGGLFDTIGPDGPDASIRPNQVLAVSFRNSALTAAQQAAVVRLVQTELLTPVGLRTLSPADPRYQGRYEGSIEHCERAAHQGSVYPWLMGPFVDAYLRVHGESSQSRAAARAFLEPLVAHIVGPGCLGGVSGIFDGDPPHRPRGCIQQLWSVAEVLRAWRKTAELKPAAGSASLPRGPDAPARGGAPDGRSDATTASSAGSR